MSGARVELAAQWRRMSEAGFTIDTVREELALYQHELTDSGAFLRDAERWGKEQDEMDVSQIEAVAEYRFELLCRLTQAIGETGEEFRFADFETDEGMLHAEHGGRAGGGMSGKTRTKNRKSDVK